MCRLLKLHSAVSIAYSLSFCLIIPSAAFGQSVTKTGESEKERAAPASDQQIFKLINQLDSEKYELRESALKQLIKIGLPAAPSLIRTTLDPKRSYEVRNRCLKILIKWSREGDGKQFDTIARQIAAIPTDKSKQPDELRLLREYYQLDLSTDPKVALQKLKAGGIKISGGIGSSRLNSAPLQLDAHRWQGPERQLAYLGRVNQDFNLRTTPKILDQMIDHLPASQIIGLFISRPVTDLKFRRFPVVPQPVDELVCRKLTQIRTLRRLDFTEVKIPKNGFKHLAKCVRLESLTLPTGTTDDDLEFLKSLTHLKELRFHNAFDVKGEGLAHLSQLKNLEKLELFYTSISGNHLKHLTDLPKLKHLYAPQVRMDDDGMRQIAQIDSLEELRLDNTRVTNKGLAMINKMPNLRSLSLTSGSFSDAGVLKLISLPSLNSVSASAGLITAEVKTQLKSQNASFQISGQFFKPNSAKEYGALEGLLKRGLQVAQYPRPNNLTLQLFPNQWSGDVADIHLISSLNQVKHLRLYVFGDQPEKLISELIKVDHDFEVRILPDREDARNVLRNELADKIRKRFPTNRR